MKRSFSIRCSSYVFKRGSYKNLIAFLQKKKRDQKLRVFSRGSKTQLVRQSENKKKCLQNSNNRKMGRQKSLLRYHYTPGVVLWILNLIMKLQESSVHKEESLKCLMCLMETSNILENQQIRCCKVMKIFLVII